MRALLLADSVFSRREHPLLQRLAVGLADEGVEVHRAVPERTAKESGESLLAAPLAYRDRGFTWTRKLRTEALAARVQERLGKNKLDLIHAFGGAGWPVATQLAGLLGTRLLLEVWRPHLVDRARSIAEANPQSVVLLAPDRPIEQLLARGQTARAVRRVEWGTHAPARATSVFREGRSPGVSLIGQGWDQAAFVAALQGAARAIRDRPDILLFVDASAARRAQAWPMAKKLGVEHRMSLVSDAEHQRDLILRTDLILYPETRGEQRSVLLDAMAHGLPIIAASDRMVSVLRDGETVHTVRGKDARAWEQALRGLLDDHDRARELGASAREFVRQHRKASSHIAQVIDAYEWSMSSDAIPFQATPTAA